MVKARKINSIYPYCVDKAYDNFREKSHWLYNNFGKKANKYLSSDLEDKTLKYVLHNGKFCFREETDMLIFKLRFQ